MTVLSKMTDDGNKSTAATRRRIVPPIPYKRPERKELHKGEYHTYKLRNTHTADGGSQALTYDLSVPYFSTGTCEDWILFRRNLDKVIKGQNVTDGPGRFTMARQLLEGDALATFNNALDGNETVANFNVCLDAVRDQVFPSRAILLQKRYMRRFLRKPAGHTTREFAARLQEINGYLPKFPRVVEGEDPVKLPDDEVLDILEFGVPVSWQKAMLLQDFDPLRHDVKAFVAFCERLEQVESTEKDSTKPAAKQGKGKKRVRIEETGGSGKKSTKHCMLHGDGSHSTEDCFTLKNQAKKMKAVYDAQTPEGRRSIKKSNELHTLIAEEVKRALKSGTKYKSVKSTKKRAATEQLEKFEQLSISEESSASSAASDSDSE